MFADRSSQVLITGGTSGIGRGLAERFARAGACVLVTGRRQDRLTALRAMHPGLRGIVSDIGVAADRERLARHVAEEMPGLNVVINNAGIQRRIGLAEDDAPWSERQAEIDVLLSGPIHLNTLLLETMLAADRPGLIVNVTSGGAYIPQPFAPVYAACKAALHSYTVTLRHALRDTAIRVVELIPPAVATGLAGPGSSHGAPLDAFCDQVFPQIAAAESPEIGYGMTATPAFEAAAAMYQTMFEAGAARFAVDGYARRSRS